MEHINLKLTEHGAIILQVILEQMKERLVLNSEKNQFELTQPLRLTFELSHFLNLEETLKQLNDVLENLQRMAVEDHQPKIDSLQKRLHAGLKNRSRKPAKTD